MVTLGVVGCERRGLVLFLEPRECKCGRWACIAAQRCLSSEEVEEVRNETKRNSRQ